MQSSISTWLKLKHHTHKARNRKKSCNTREKQPARNRMSSCWFSISIFNIQNYCCVLSWNAVLLEVSRKSLRCVQTCILWQLYGLQMQFSFRYQLFCVLFSFLVGELLLNHASQLQKCEKEFFFIPRMCDKCEKNVRSMRYSSSTIFNWIFLFSPHSKSLNIHGFFLSISIRLEISNASEIINK